MSDLALSTSWHASRHTEGEDVLREARELGFSVVELSHNIRFSLWPGILEAVESGDMRIRSVHNFCPLPLDVLRANPNCYQFTDTGANYRSAIKHTLATIEHAQKVNAEAIVLHLGRVGPEGISEKLHQLFDEGGYLSRGYTRAKTKAVEKRRQLFPEAWKRVREAMQPCVDAAGEAGLKLGIEIREAFEEFPNEEEMPEVLDAFPAEVVGYWHDFGHAARKEYLGWHDHGATLDRLSDRLVGYHLHDCRPPKRDHQALGRGGIDFEFLLPKVREEAIPVLELSPRTSREQVEASLKQWSSLVNARG